METSTLNYFFYHKLLKTNSMKFFRKTALLFLLVVAAMSVQAQDLKQYIPSDASFIVSMDLANLDSKISFDKLKEWTRERIT